MRTIKFVFPLVILNLIALILVTFGLPDMVPIHMNLVGNVDGFGFREYIPIIGMIPVFIVIAYILYFYYGHSDLNKNIEDKIIPAIAIVFIPFTWIPAIFALDLYNNINFFNFNSNFFSIELMGFLSVLIAILFISISYYIENLKPNGYFGIKTPWTLNNEFV